MRLRLLLLLACLLIFLAQPAHAERRVALVIGNGAYKSAPLKNPTNDAQDMADALRGMGFDVTLKLNATNREMEEAVRSFGTKLKQGGLGLFYYAGHGVQVAGENYLIPVDTKVEAEADVKFGALNAGMALARMEDAGNDINIVILDACRTNPFARSFRTAEQGLARMDAPKGSLIAYATAPGRVAADSGGSGRNGLFTSFLLQHMRTPGLKIEEVLKRVRADVVQATKDKQVPWESSSLIGDLYFSSSPPSTDEGKGNGLALLTLHGQKNETPDFSYLPTKQNAGVKAAIGPADNVQLHDQRNSTGWASLPASLLYEYGYKAMFEQDDIGTAKILLEEAAKRDHAKSQDLLGVIYDVGNDNGGISRNIELASYWYKIAADNGLAEAQYHLACIYDNQLKHEEAITYFRKAALQGHSGAQVDLGTKYYAGQGVPVDYNMALHWWSKAANNNEPMAIRKIGYLYETGSGVLQDYKEAMRLYEIAASRGEIVALYYIGVAYKDGKISQKDLKQAYAYLSVASSYNVKGAAEARDQVAANFSQTQMRDAQSMASELAMKFSKASKYDLSMFPDADDKSKNRSQAKRR